MKTLKQKIVDKITKQAVKKGHKYWEDSDVTKLADALIRIFKRDEHYYKQCKCEDPLHESNIILCYGCGGVRVGE